MYNNMAEYLTTNLSVELDGINKAFNRWAEKQIDWIDGTDKSYRQQMEECDCTIAALKENEIQLENARFEQDQIKSEQRGEIERCLQLTERYRQQRKTLEAQLRKYEEDEERETSRLENVRLDYEKERTKMEQALNDLTQGIKLYTSLGLDFNKEQVDGKMCMKFKFTQIDAKDPNRQFFFLLYVDDDDIYRLVQTSPQLDPEFTNKHVQIINTDNDIGKFVVNMRRGFCKLV